MSLASVSLPCKAGGRSIITLNLCGQQTGSSTDRSQWRIIRRMSGAADAVLVGTPDFALTGNRDVRSWTWIDDNIPADGTYAYVLQINRVSGGGTIYEMVLLGQHFKR